MLPIPQTLRTNAVKRQVLSCAQLIIFAIATSKILAATSTALKKNYFSVKDAVDCVQEFLNVVVTLNRKDALLTVIITAQMYQKDELVFFNPWKLEGFFIQNHHIP
jgi:D-hexose-6-phosphate mutarotase